MKDIYEESRPLMGEEHEAGLAPMVRPELEDWLFRDLPERKTRQRVHLLKQLCGMPQFLAALFARDEAMDIAHPGAHHGEGNLPDHTYDTVGAALLVLIPGVCPGVMRHADYHQFLRSVLIPAPGSYLAARPPAERCQWADSIVLALNQMEAERAVDASGTAEVALQLVPSRGQENLQIDMRQLMVAVYMALRVPQSEDMLAAYLRQIPRHSIDALDLVGELSEGVWPMPANRDDLRAAGRGLRAILVNARATYWTGETIENAGGFMLHEHTPPAVQAMLRQLHQLPRSLREAILV